MATQQEATPIRIDSRRLKRVDALASAMNRSRAWVIKRAVDHYLDYDNWFVREVEQGLKEADAGEVVDHETVMRKWERKRETSVDSRRNP